MLAPNGARHRCSAIPANHEAGQASVAGDSGDGHHAPSGHADAPPIAPAAVSPAKLPVREHQPAKTRVARCSSDAAGSSAILRSWDSPAPGGPRSTTTLKHPSAAVGRRAHSSASRAQALLPRSLSRLTASDPTSCSSHAISNSSSSSPPRGLHPEQLHRRFWADRDASAVYRRLRKLGRRGYLVSDQTWYHGPLAVRVTRDAMRAAGLPFHPFRSIGRVSIPRPASRLSDGSLRWLGARPFL